MISIFAKEAFLNTNPYSPFKYEGRKPKHGHLQRVSSMIRGTQIAEHTQGIRLNPLRDYENDVCIYVKPHIKKGTLDFNFEGKKNYIDIIDGHNLGQVAANYPDVGVIVCSQADMETMSGVIPNTVVYIPQQHVNFENIKRVRTEVIRVGVIGTAGAFPYLPEDLKSELEKRGMELVLFSEFYTRQDIIDFYMSIDIQVVWRPYKKLLSNPLKLVNAASFGVPTIALDEKAFKEMGDTYIPVETSTALLYQIDCLKKYPVLYQDYSLKAIEKAKNYHIDYVGMMYNNLDI